MRGGLYEKPISRGDCLKRGAWPVCRFKGDLSKKGGGGMFLRGVLIPQFTLWLSIAKTCLRPESAPLILDR